MHLDSISGTTTTTAAPAVGAAIAPRVVAAGCLRSPCAHTSKLVFVLLVVVNLLHDIERAVASGSRRVGHHPGGAACVLRQHCVVPHHLCSGGPAACGGA